ncbi:predicted protein [Aspergillus terreus NIH2624]|uniref:DUF3752 domain-containing protein n=1 Tax=Aspergillus terreus (strain NIH 2624 / FGSC A1156) TaxID=341663 RepID=Q0C7D0_ASPTN|nr:uncharacterized protein ATEG_10404 [Aspergillus terreus NIH2624]EAU29401.1 predicted protein [Aspergillus terreus NIH2624]
MDQGEKRKSTEPITEDADDLASKRRRVIGPSLPSQESDAKPEAAASESDSSDDDDFGPSLPPADSAAPDTRGLTSKQAEAPVSERESSEAGRSADVKSQRDDWMLQPPGATDWAQRVDPTKLRNRKFQTGKSATGRSEGVDSSWTETPEQKMRRLQDQVMGVASHSSSGGRGPQTTGSSRNIQDKVKSYKEAKAAEAAKVGTSKRPQFDSSGKDDDDPSSRAFDREKDMSISSTITNAQRREVINKAADFGSRFTSGKFL